MSFKIPIDSSIVLPGFGYQERLEATQPQLSRFLLYRLMIALNCPFVGGNSYGNPALERLDVFSMACLAIASFFNKLALISIAVLPILGFLRQIW